MCVTCGCTAGAEAIVDGDAGHGHSHGGSEHHHDHAGGHAHDHQHAHDHGHGHDHEHAATTTVALERDLLEKNRLLAERNRGWLAGRDVLALNLMSSPGSGKTTLLERTLRDMAGEFPLQVVEGDQATDYDAQRIRAAGSEVVQVNTGTGCHLDAAMLQRAFDRLDPPRGGVVLIENVGNLVCPALFDLGERARVVVASVTEGEDKPHKYPHMFRSAHLLLLNKIDLLPHVRFDVDRCITNALEVNPRLEVLKLSAETGEGMAAWYAWIRDRRAELAQAGAAWQ